MDKPVCGGHGPIKVNLEPGTYYWCACGRSKKQPFCDGSHNGTSFVPLKMEVTVPRRMNLCTCKLTKIPPRCDGSHHHAAEVYGTPAAGTEHKK